MKPEEIAAIKEFHCGVTLTHPCCEEIPRLIADLERARELLGLAKSISDGCCRCLSYDDRGAAIDDYLRGMG